MLNSLVRRFVPNPDTPEDRKTREAYGVLAGGLGILINLILFAIKLPIGWITGSIAISSDAFNNLSDMGSSLVSVIGARMASKEPDREHPFGHGRIEYISALIVAFMILLMGIELFRESVDKLLNPQPVLVNPLLLSILAASTLMKVFMYRYNRLWGEKIHSSVLRATASDSLNDVITTATVILATILGGYVSFPVDGIAGLLVSLLILRAGYGVARDTIDLLLGGKPSPALIRDITTRIRAGEGIVGVHDVIVHDYGPGRQFASAHAEVPDDGDVVRLHEVIDEIEQQIKGDLGVAMVIHMDPISVHCEQTNALREEIAQVIAQVDPMLSFHDFRMTGGESRVNLIFDIVVPVKYSAEKREALCHEIAQRMTAIDRRYRCVIEVDNDYVN